MILNRYEKLFAALQADRLDAVAINPGPSMVYLTGLNFHLMERPVVAFFTAGGASAIVLPELEMRKLEQAPAPMDAYPYGDNPNSWEQAFRRAVSVLNLDGKLIGVEPEHLRVLELRFLEAAAPKAHFLSADPILANLRLVKDEEEIAAIRKAVEIAQAALTAILPKIKVGVSERELAADLSIALLQAGSDPGLGFSPIVAAGPNSANPHAVPTDRRLARGDLLVIDWGAAYQGYLSDLTRTFALDPVEPELERIAEITIQANSAGRQGARPGIPAGAVDRAARSIIEDGGYGQYFTHRVGHGLGMKEHEEPYMFAENQELLLPGMVFTVEPGIYLPGRGGVRIEDDVVVIPGGAETLSSLDRGLMHISS